MMLSKTNATTFTLSLVFLQVLLIASRSLAHSYWEAADNYYYWATLSESESTLECTDASNDPPTAKIIRVPKTEQPKNDAGLPDVFEGESSGTFVFPVGSGKGAIAGIGVDPQYVWFTSPTSKQFGRLEKSAFESLDENTIVQDEAEYFDVTAADKPYGIAVDPDKVWITHQESERVASYSRNTGEEINTLDYATEGIAGRVPWGIAVDRNFVWVANHGSTLGTDSVIQIDRVTGELVREIMVLPHTDSISPRGTVAGIYSDGSFLWLPVNDLVPSTDPNTNEATLVGSVIKFDIANDVEFPTDGINRVITREGPIYITGDFERVWVSHTGSPWVISILKESMALDDPTELEALMSPAPHPGYGVGSFKLNDNTTGRGVSQSGLGHTPPYLNGNCCGPNPQYTQSVAAVAIGDQRVCAGNPGTPGLELANRIPNGHIGTYLAESINPTITSGNTAPSFGDMSGWLYDHSFGPLTQSFFLLAASSCKAVNPGDSIRLQSKETGLTNTETDRSIPVVCPINRETFNQFSSTNNDRIVLKLQAENSGDMDVSMPCAVNNYRGISEVTITTGGTSELALQKAISGELEWDLKESIDSLGSIAITCDLPPQTAITSIETRVLY